MTIHACFPDIPYLPQNPREYAPGIGLIGCGGIAYHHLEAYQSAGYRVLALCDLKLANAEERRDQFFPKAKVYSDYHEMLKLDEIEVVDVTTHPEVRPPLVRDALLAGKHVLSQKPFVLDLNIGKELADLADQQGVLLAINQNGRWAPHFSYLREAILAGLIGDLVGIHCGLHWDHGWVEGTVFEKVKHLILYDFAIHWFDFIVSIVRDLPPRRVYASAIKSSRQRIDSPMLAEVMIEYDHLQVSLVFDGHVLHGSWDSTLISGTEGLIRSSGENANSQRIELITKQGTISPKIHGKWFSDGFHGTMGELLCAIEDGRQPTNNARNNLHSLELCFAAVASSLRHEPVVPGSVKKIEDL